MDNHDNYEGDYRASLEEVRRLRGVARDYGDFYGKIKEAALKKNWELIETALKEHA